jgi:hypothetical protein
VIVPGQHHHHGSKSAKSHAQKPAKWDRWLVGVLAGAALIYLTGKIIGLGKRKRPVVKPTPIST